MKRDLNILLIDDNPDHVRIIVWALEQSEVKNRVTVIEDGQKALELLQNIDNLKSILRKIPDIIFLDINLPKVNGIDLLQYIKNDPQLKSIPVIILSSSDRIEDVENAYAHSANTYISKSQIFNEVARSLNTVCVYWATVAELSTRS